MTDPSEDELGYHLFVDREEIPIVTRALRLLISDEAHEHEIRRLAREVIEQLTSVPEHDAAPLGSEVAAGSPDASTGRSELLTLTLSPQGMKITHTAVRLLFDDLQRGQSAEREILRRVLGKLPDEHSIRAIQLR